MNDGEVKEISVLSRKNTYDSDAADLYGFYPQSAAIRAFRVLKILSLVSGKHSLHIITAHLGNGRN